MSTAAVDGRPLPSRWRDQAMRQTAGYYALFICLGLNTAITGPTLLDLARQTGSSVGDTGLLFLGGGIGVTLGTLWGGKLFDRVHGHTLLGGAQLIAAACFVVVPYVPWLWPLVAIAFCRGLMEGLVNTGGNALLLWTHGEKASPYMNGLHFSFGLGAFLSPLMVARIPADWGGYRAAYWGAALFSALAGMSVLAMRSCPTPPERTGTKPESQGADRTKPESQGADRAKPESQGADRAKPESQGADRTKPESQGADRTIRRLPVLVAALYLFAYVGAEISFGSWIYTYSLALGVVTATGGAYLTSGFWLSFTLGRLLSIPVAVRFTPRQVIPVALGGCLVLSALMLFWPPSIVLLWAVTLGLGLFMAPLWPSGFTLAGQIMSMTALATGLVLLGDSLGGMVLPALTGKVIEGVGIERLPYSLPLLVFGSIVACGLAYVALLAIGRRSERAAGSEGAVEGEARGGAQP